ncbi:hypothetical protein WDW86_08430 [Bdellovibrionota bacterium FG-2]
MADKDDQGKTFSSFTVDATNPGVTQMPGITKLLNRKKLGLPGGTKMVSLPSALPPGAPPGPPPMKAPPIVLAAPPRAEISIQLVDIQINDALPLPVEPTHSIRKAVVHPATRRQERRSTYRIKLWKKEELSKSSDPLEAALNIFLQASATRALFMTQIANQSPGNGTHIFCGHGAIGERTYLALWTGFLWNTSLTPEVSSQLFKAKDNRGWIELALIQAHDANNSFRRAVGCDSEEFLSLYICGPQNAPTGILMVFSKSSLASLFPKVKELLRSIPPLLTTGTKAA